MQHSWSQTPGYIIGIIDVASVQSRDVECSLDIYQIVNERDLKILISHSHIKNGPHIVNFKNKDIRMPSKSIRQRHLDLFILLSLNHTFRTQRS